MKRIIAIGILIAAEIVAAFIPTVLAAVPLMKLAYAERGYKAYGGEWLLIIAIYVVSFYIIHNKVCDKIFEED